jgi:anti-anti-sigma factor
MANHDDVLRVTVEPLDDARLIRAAGEIDLGSVAALRRELDAARVEAVTVLLDLSGVTFIDSSGLHLLLRASDSSAGSDWGFSVVRPSESVLRLIELSGTADMLTVVDPTAERVSAEAGIR